MSKSDIIKGNTSFFIYVCALEIGVFVFIATMCAHFSNLNDSTTLMLKAHKWIPTTLCIISAIGWIFHGIYLSNHIPGSNMKKTMCYHIRYGISGIFLRSVG